MRDRGEDKSMGQKYVVWGTRAAEFYICATAGRRRFTRRTRGSISEMSITMSGRT